MWKYDTEMAEVLITTFFSLFMDKFIPRPWCTPPWFWKEMDSRAGLSTKVRYVCRYLGQVDVTQKWKLILHAESWPLGEFSYDQQKKSSIHFLKGGKREL